MKTTEIIKTIKSVKGITDYEIINSVKDSRELFYVLKNLELNRAVKTSGTSITVYADHNNFKGSSLISVTSADDKVSLTKKLKDALIKAKTADNPYYPLLEKTTNYTMKKPLDKNLNAIACNVGKAVFKADHYKNGWINSTEIFVSKTMVEFINSKGVHHKEYRFNIQIEVIPTWSNKKEEFELYKFFETSKIDYKQITKEVEEILELSKARSMAININELKLPENLNILIKGDMRDLIANHLGADISYRNVVYKQNHYKLGDKISETTFCLTKKPITKGASNSCHFDSNGVLLKAKKIIKESVINAYHGDIRFGYYLNEKKITGILPITKIEAETFDYKKDKYLLIDNFSSPQLIESSGYFGGEIRLGRYFDGKKFIPVTGFSISGNLYEELKTIRFSKEQEVDASYEGPKFMIFSGMKIH